MTLMNRTEAPRWINHAIIREAEKVAADESEVAERRAVATHFLALSATEKLAFFSFIHGALHNEPQLAVRTVRL